MATRRRIEPEGRTRTLLVQDAEGEFQLDLPSGWRVTHGPDVPYDPRKSNPGNDPVRSYALRVYRDKTNASLAGVYARVVSWRDTDTGFRRTVIRKGGDGVEYLASAIVADSFAIPHGYQIYQRAKGSREWTATDTQVTTEAEARSAINQLIQSTKSLRKSAGLKVSDDVAVQDLGDF